jgi:hypothetical protein
MNSAGELPAWLHFLPVGYPSANLIVTDDGERVLFDAGYGGQPRPPARRHAPRWRHRGAKRPTVLPDAPPQAASRLGQGSWLPRDWQWQVPRAEEAR